MFKAIAICVILMADGAASTAFEVRRDVLRRANSMVIDLGYATYQGYYNATSGLNVWKGIRYAAAPSGTLRWEPPQTPATNKTTQPAESFGPICPQAYPAVPGAPFVLGDEDCLFLNVYAPSTGSKLPVLVWIHGGGYGYGNGQQDLSTIINANGNSFIGVAIQYRLGAFGFLSSNEVKANGVVNAGLLDIQFALGWVQAHIGLFGGDASRVTISGESAGGGAVMLLGIAKGGTLGTSLYQNGIAASPWHPAQYDYNATRPTSLYYELAKAVGCGSSDAVLTCLRSTNSLTLQEANSNITTGGTYGTWSYLPVTDYTFITSEPSVALSSKKVNGANILVSNNANEGALFVPANITTLADLKIWLSLEFPIFSAADIESVLDAYPSSDVRDNPADPKFATNGISPPTAVNVSQAATGQQQRGYDIYAEATFICASYWLNNAYGPSNSYHYQYSVPFAGHTDDVTAYMGPSVPNQSAEFSQAVRDIWGNFITSSSPVVSTDSTLSKWPAWVDGTSPHLMNLNETGGTPYQTTTLSGQIVTQYMEPGLRNNFTIANAYTWEGGRGKRCEFWKNIASKVPI